MVLDTSQKIGPDEVEAICSLPDDLFRLRWVTYAYYDISKRLAVGLKDNSPWPTFARWSAFTISEALRLDEVNPRLEEVLRRHALPAAVAEPLVALQQKLRSLDNGAMPTVLALGNRLVFHEVGWALANFLQWIEDQSARDQKAWDDYREREIKPFSATDFFRPSYPEWLRDGIGEYFEAWWENDETKKAQRVLRGNILIGAYEQWRVDSFFEVALDFNPGALVKELRVDHAHLGTTPVGVGHAGTRRALRHQWALLDWMADAYAAFLTRFILTFDAPLYDDHLTALRLGSNIPRRDRTTTNAQGLGDIDADTQRLFAEFDRSGGLIQGFGARNWRRFTDRMSFIVNLFRSQQTNAHLRLPPTRADERLLALQLNDAHLDGLRRVGDDRSAELIPTDELEGREPQEFARSFVTRGSSYQSIVRQSLKLKIDYPAWAQPDKIARGQQFFDKYAIEIASALFTASLPKAYTGARGSRVLLTTAELVSDVSRRIAETARLLLDVMMPDPNGLMPGSRGYTAALTVRGFHEAIRRMLADQEPWKSEWHETPINQEDLFGTLATFTVVVIETLETMGIDVSEEERDAYLHTWLVAGYLLGIDYDGLRNRKLDKTQAPLTYFEMQLVGASVFRRQAAPSPSGQILTRALLAMQEDALPRALRPLPPAAMRRYIGDESADMLEIPPAGPMRVLLGAFGPLGTAADWLTPGHMLRARLETMTTEILRTWMTEQPARLGGWCFEDGYLVHRRNETVDLTQEPGPYLWEDERSAD